MDKSEALIAEFLQAAQEKGYNDIRTEVLLGLACSQEAEEFYGSLEAALSALLRLCRTCKDDDECQEKFCNE